MPRTIQLDYEDARRVGDIVLQQADPLEQGLQDGLNELGPALGAYQLGFVTLGVSPEEYRRPDIVLLWTASDARSMSIATLHQEMKTILQHRECYEALLSGEMYAQAAGEFETDDANIRSRLLVPVTSNPGLVGVLLVASREDHLRLDPDCRPAMDLVCRHIGLVLAERRASLYQSILEYTTDLISVVAADGQSIYRSPSHMEVLGVTAEEFADMTPWEFFDPGDVSKVFEAFEPIANTPGGRETVELHVRAGDGERRVVLATCVNVMHDPALGGYLTNARDVTQQKDAEQRMKWLASHDPLTRLPNRAYFIEQLSTAAAAVRRGEEQIAVLFLDLDGFKRVNDEFGHIAGDELLRAVALRLKESVRQEDLIARMGGDEFVVLIRDVTEWAEVEATAWRLIDTMRFPFETDHDTFTVRVSIGVAFDQVPEYTEDAFVHAADTALYAAKDQGRGRAVRYTSDLAARWERTAPGKRTC
ncbi:MAG: diguanylate cyclase domain-containing protein [Chloroflexota bacterium]